MLPPSPAPAGSNCTTPDLTYITLEEHYDSPASLPAQQANGVYAILAKFMAGMFDKYTTDITQYRIPSMNNNSIKMSVSV